MPDTPEVPPDSTDSGAAVDAVPPLPDGVPEVPEPQGFSVEALMQPMLDMLSTFGTGVFESLDPTAIIDAISGILTGAAEQGMSALSALGSLWEGPEATAATAKGTAAMADTGLVAEQGTEISALTGTAAAAVATGQAELIEIIESFQAVVDSVGPAIVLPPGQAIVAAAAAEHTAQAIEVVTRVKAELSELSGQMAAAGRPVPVTEAPMEGMLSMATAAAGVASSLVGPVVSAVTGVISMPLKALSGIGSAGSEALSSFASEATSGSLLDTIAGDDVVAADLGADLTGSNLALSEADSTQSGVVGAPTGGVATNLTALGTGVNAATGQGRLQPTVPPTTVPSTIAPPATTPSAPTIEPGARTVPAEQSSRGSGFVPMAGGARASGTGVELGVNRYALAVSDRQLADLAPLVPPPVLGTTERVLTDSAVPGN